MRISKTAKAKINKVKEEHEENIFRKPNVVGVAIAEKITDGKPTGRPALTVYVEKKLAPSQLRETDMVKPEVDGVETDVVETGEIVALANTSRLRPALHGVSIGHATGGSGTLGCVLDSEADGRQYILSNNHVIANFNTALIGDNVFQPSIGDGGSPLTDRIATVARYPLVSQTSDNLVDCAIAQVLPTAGTPNVRPATLDAWTEVRQIPGWFGSEDQDGDVALARIANPQVMDLVVFHLDNPGGENHGYYRVGRSLDGDGNPTQGWTGVFPVPGWFGAEDQGAGIGIADINGSGRPDLLVFHIDNPGGENHGYYRIGWDMNVDGAVSSWSDIKSIPGWFGSEDQGGAVALLDINDNGRPELFVLHIDNPGGENRAYYRIGWDMDPSGNVSRWSDPIAIPGWFGTENQGAGIALGYFSHPNRPDMVVYHIDNPGGENTSYYRFGRRIRPDGSVPSWSEIRQVSGWMGTENQGAGITAGDINGDGIDELVTFFLDNPSGENQGYYRVAFDIGRSGDYKASLRGATPAGLNSRVWKSGRTTELTNGTITGVNATFNINRTAGGPLWGRFVNQFAITPGISRPGDSGSTIVNAQNRVVGLLHAGTTTDTITIASPIEAVLDVLRYSDVQNVPGWFGAEDQGADVAVADISGNGRPDLVVFHVDNPGGENHGYYRVGWNLDANGTVRGGWSPIMDVPGWFGSEDQGAGIAIADITGNGRPDLIVFHVDNPGGENHGYYRIGFNLDTNGVVTGGWSSVKAVPGWFGSEDQGAAIAIADINGNGQADLLVFHIDNPGGENHGYYRIGWNLNANGDPMGGWSPIMSVPGWFGAEDQGAGVAISDVTGNGRPDLIVFHLDNPAGENHGYYRIGRDLNNLGQVTGGWTAIQGIPGWFGAEDQGAGIAVTDLNGNGRPDLVVLHVDNPAGENAAYYRIAFDLMPSGAPARFTVAEAGIGAQILPAVELTTSTQQVLQAMHEAEFAATASQAAAARAAAATQAVISAINDSATPQPVVSYETATEEQVKTMAAMGGATMPSNSGVIPPPGAVGTSSGLRHPKPRRKLKTNSYSR